MDIQLADGKYVVGVSGGVDSMVLLHALQALSRKQPGVELIVAHFDHGIRLDSRADAQLVEQTSKEHGLTCELGEGNLGADASEDTARRTRYHFLDIVRTKHSADAVITAHHQDDFVETAVINIIRGTGRLGLSSLRSRPGLLRPLLDFSKQQLLDYAKQHNLSWNEDSTNTDTTYLRNKVRLEMWPKFSTAQQKIFLAHCSKVAQLNQQIDQQLSELLTHRSYRRGQRVYSRVWFNSLPHDFAEELVHFWLHRHNVPSYDRKQIDSIVIQLKSLPAGKKVVAGTDRYFLLTKRSIRLYLGV